MNDFKEKNKVPLYEFVKEDLEQGRTLETTKRKKEIILTEKEKERNENINLILSFYNRELSDQEKEKLLAIDVETLPNHMFYTLFCMAKDYMKTGEFNKETFIKCVKPIPKKTSLGGAVPEKWQKAPEKNKAEDGEVNDEREI